MKLEYAMFRSCQDYPSREGNISTTILASRGRLQQMLEQPTSEQATVISIPAIGKATAAKQSLIKKGASDARALRLRGDGKETTTT